MDSLYSSKKIPRRVFPVSNWIEGLSNYNKTGGGYVWARGVDYRTEPSQVTLLPQAIAETATFTDLGKWAEQVVGRTVTLGSSTNLISNGSFETNTTGWTLGADFTRSSSDAYIGSYSIKQLSTSGTVAITTASGSGISVTPYADYQLIFYNKVTVTSGQAPQLTILGGSLSGPNLLSTPMSLPGTSSVWSPITVTFNAGQYSSVFISIANQGGSITAYYDYFTLVQINSLATYVFGNTGVIYKRYSNGAWVTLGTVPNSHGNGMGYYGEDDFVYVMGDKTIGRYGPISSGTPTLVPDYLTAQGGVPTNTNSLSLTAASSQYAAKATPSSALKITSDLSLEVFIKPTSLPAIGSSMTLAGIWKESTNNRSYKLDLYGISGFFGDGSDGNLTISSPTTDAPVDSACSGTIATNQLNATNASFVANQKILIIQMQGTGAGTKQYTTIQSYDSTNHIITTNDNLNFSYNSSGSNKAQVIVMKQYANITVNSTWTAKAWNGTVGGILAYYYNGTLSGAGHISADACGFRGGAGGANATGTQGESSLGVGTVSISNNGAAGGGGKGGVSFGGGGGGGAGHTIAGVSGNTGGSNGTGGTGGSTIGTSDLSTMFIGAGGGGGGSWNNTGGSQGGVGGNGGGGIILLGPTASFTGTITCAGQQGTAGNTNHDSGAGGGGAAGFIYLAAQIATLGSNIITAAAGAGGVWDGTDSGANGGAGSYGRIHLSYLISYTGTTNPSADVLQDNTLVTTSTTQARLGISNDGTAFEYLTQNLKSIAIGAWDRIQVSWRAATSTAAFYEGGTLVGTSTGAKTAIFSSSADFAVGANFVSAYANFFDGLINDVRVWNTTRTQQQFADNNLMNLQGVSSGLVGSWYLSSSSNDQTSSGNNLTTSGSPTFSTDVPYPGATTRLDIDQTGGTTANTVTLATSLSEATLRTFVPAQDPQKSFGVNIGAKGTGDWTLVIHNGLNQAVATVTVTNANLPSSGAYEFVYSSVFIPVVGATYHAHIYSTVADGTLKCTTVSDFTTINFTSYYQFLVNDTEYHPGMQMGNVFGIGNGRYLATVDAAAGYNSRRLRFPAGWRVRALATWRGYYAIGCWKGTNIKDFDQGIVFLWDGFSITYNDFFFVPEGGVNAMWGENGTLYIVAGYHGDILEYTGGDRAIKVKRIPRVGKAKYVEVEPGAITYYDSLLRIGVAYNSDSTTLERGVYTWGRKYEDDAKSLSYDYPISTGNRFSTVALGAMVPVGGSLLVCYQDNVSYGINNINPGNAPQTIGTLEELITDVGPLWKQKDLQTVRADHLPLLTGENIDVKYKINYESSWHNLGITSQAVGDMVTRLPISAPSASEFHSLQIAVDLYAANGTSPTLLEHSQLTDLQLGDSDENSLY